MISLGINSDQVIEAIFEGLILRGHTGNAENTQLALPGLEESRQDLFIQWETASEREKRSRTMFAQETIKVDEVSAELIAVRSAIGSNVDVETFTREAFSAHGAVVSQLHRGTIQVDPTEAPQALRDTVMGGSGYRFRARFELPVVDDERYLSRTHPIVEGLATYVMDTALDPSAESIARRCGVIRTSRVSRRTTLLLVRIRFHIIMQQGKEERALLAEDCQILAFTGSPANAEWISDNAFIEQALEAPSEANIYPEQAKHFLQQLLENMALLQPRLDQVARERGEELLTAHRRVRSASQVRGVRYHVEPQLPVDMLGTYIYLPKA